MANSLAQAFSVQTIRCSRASGGRIVCVFSLFCIFLVPPPMSQPRRSARIAGRQAQNEPIVLDDDDTDSIVSASSRCEVCHEPAPRAVLVHIPCCNSSTDFPLMTEWTRCAHIVQWIFVEFLIKVIIFGVFCVVALVAKNRTQ